MADFCPLLKKNCIRHDCKFFVHLLGKDPQTGKEIDKFDCAVSFLPILLIENAQQTRQAGAAIESFRNEHVNGTNAVVLTLASAIQGKRQIKDIGSDHGN